MDEQQIAFKGVWIPAEIWLNENLSFQEKFLYAEIDSFCSKGNPCFASNNYLGKMLGISGKRIGTLITSLVNKGFLYREVNRNERNEVVNRLLSPIDSSCKVVRPLLPQSGKTPPPTKCGDPSSPKRGDINNIFINKLNIKKHTKKSQEQELTDRFETIWQDYPKKQGKAVAFKAYKKAVSEGVTDDVIKQGIAKYKSYLSQTETETRFIKQGSTWFNQQCWNDDYTVKEEEYGRRPSKNFGQNKAGNGRKTAEYERNKWHNDSDGWD